jgi:hypothetical protein
MAGVAVPGVAVPGVALGTTVLAAVSPAGPTSMVVFKELELLTEVQALCTLSGVLR